MTKKRASPVVLALNIVLWCGVGYVGLSMAAMHLGAAMHDAYCKDH